MHLIVEREKKKGVISLFSSIPALPAPPPALKSPAIVVHAFSQGQTGKKESANMHFFLSTTAVGGKKKKKARAKKLAETEKKKKKTRRRPRDRLVENHFTFFFTVTSLYLSRKTTGPAAAPPRWASPSGPS